MRVIFYGIYFLNIVMYNTLKFRVNILYLVKIIQNLDKTNKIKTISSFDNRHKFKVINIMNTIFIFVNLPVIESHHVHVKLLSFDISKSFFILNLNLL